MASAEADNKAKGEEARAESKAKAEEASLIPAEAEAKFKAAEGKARSMFEREARWLKAEAEAK